MSVGNVSEEQMKKDLFNRLLSLEDFEVWWEKEGSYIWFRMGESTRDLLKRACHIAWEKGEKNEKEKNK